MTPTTPTGKRLARLFKTDEALQRLLDVEREAAAQERERLRAKASTSRTAIGITVFLDWLFDDDVHLLRH